MKTNKLHQMLGGSGGNFDRLANSALGQKLLAAANRQDQKRQASQLDPRFSQPHVAVLRQKLAGAARADLFANSDPAISRFDAVMLAVHTARSAERDQGMRRLALHLHKLWEKDRSGSLSVGQLAKLRAHYAGEYPKSGVPAFFDDVLPAAGFHQLPIRKLQALATRITAQADYDAVVEDHGLSGADVTSVRARAYLRALVESRQADAAIVESREPKQAVTPPGISEETMHELKEKEERGEIENAYAVAWSIAEDKKKGRRAGDAADAGEQEWHPDINEGQGKDAVDADKVMKGQRSARRLAQDRSQNFLCRDCNASVWGPADMRQCPECGSDNLSESQGGGRRDGRRAEKPAEPEFKPAINQEQGPQRDLPEDDAELRAARRSLAQVESDAPEDAELGEQVETLVEKHKQENAPAERREQARKARRRACIHRKGQYSTQVDPDVCPACGRDIDFDDPVVRCPAGDFVGCGTCGNQHLDSTGHDSDVEIEPLGNAKTAASRARRISRTKIEDALLAGRTIVVAGYGLRLASRSGRDQIEMAGPDQSPMAWPMKKLTAAVEYFAKVVEGQAEDDPDAGLVMCTSCGRLSEFEPVTGEDGSDYMQCQRCGGLDTMREMQEGRSAQAGDPAADLAAQMVSQMNVDDKATFDPAAWREGVENNIAYSGPEYAGVSVDDVLAEMGRLLKRGRRAQALEAPSVNEQQPDAVKPPKAKQPLGPESSGQDVDSLEADSIEDQHPAQDQAGTSEPSGDMSEGGAIPDPGRIPVEHDPGKNSGTSFPDTDLGPERSAEEPAAFEPQVSPGRSARVDRRGLRAALRGTVKHVAQDDEEPDEEDDVQKKAPFDAF